MFSKLDPAIGLGGKVVDDNSGDGSATAGEHLADLLQIGEAGLAIFCNQDGGIGPTREQRACARDEEGRTGEDDIVKFAAPIEQEGVEGGGGEHVVGEEEGISS